MLTIFDYLVLAVLVCSTALGVWRGLIGELVALLSWVAAIFAARQFGDQLGTQGLSRLISEPWIASLAGMVIIGFAVLVVMGILRVLLAKAVSAAGLGLSNAFLGFVFGLLRGGIIIVLLAMAGGLTQLPKEPWWRDALTAPYIVFLIEMGRPWLPEMVQSRINFNP